jgi:hypothetical protein
MVDASGQGEHLAPLVGGPACRDQRTRGVRGLDHEHGLRERGDQPVAQREVLRARRLLGLALGEEQSAFEDTRQEVALRPGAGDAIAQDRDRAAARVERSPVGALVDAARVARDDHDAGLREHAREAPRLRLAVGRRRARTYERHARSCGEQLRASPQPERLRRSVDRPQGLGPETRVGQDPQGARAGVHILKTARRPGSCGLAADFLQRPQGMETSATMPA